MSPNRRVTVYGSFVGAALVLLVVFAIARTHSTATTPADRASSNYASGFYDALRETKFAYAVASTSASQLRPVQDRAAKLSRMAPLPVKATRESRSVDAVIRSWRSIASPQHRRAQRCLGICLGAFGRTGAFIELMKASVPPPQVPARTSQRKSRLSVESPSASKVSRADEQALWSALYSEPPPAPETINATALHNSIKLLDLGWFEHLALLRLSERKGDATGASRERQAALSSAMQYTSFESLYIALIVVGTCTLVIFLLHRAIQLGTGQKLQQAEPVTEVEAAESVPTGLTYRSRASAFVFYLCVYLFIGYPLRRLTPNTSGWSAQQLLRFTAFLQISLSLVLVACALVLLRRLVNRESLAAGDKTRITMRQMLESVGFVSQDAAGDIRTALFSYLIAMPVFIGLSIVSSYIFRSVHTPINPVQLEGMLASSPLDRILLLIETAVVAPIVEETMFRGVLMPALMSRWGRAGGMVVSSAIFALLHPNLPEGFLPLFGIGLAFAIVFSKRRTLLPSIVMHSVHNGIITITMILLFSS